MQSTLTNYMHQYSSSAYDDAILDKSVADFGMDSYELSAITSDFASIYQQQSLRAAGSNHDSNNSTTLKNSNWSLSIEIENSFQSSANNTTQIQQQFKQEDNFDWFQQQNSLLQASAMMSPISPATTVNSSPSPCPSDYQYQAIATSMIKREHAFLPPSPPESNGVPSPQYHHIDCFKTEQVDEKYNLLSPSSTEDSIDINKILNSENFCDERPSKDYNTLREVLQDTSFQRKHNLKPMTLESLFGDFEQEKDIEPVISLALQHAKLEIQATCQTLNISANPQHWTPKQVQLWMNFTIKQFELDPIANCELVFTENGQNFAMLGDEEFFRRANQTGSVLHAQLEIWKAAYSDASCIVDNTLTSLTEDIQYATSSSDSTVTSSTSQWMATDERMFSDNSEDEDSEMEAKVNIDNIVVEDKKETAEPVVNVKPKSSKKHPTHMQKKGTQSAHIHLWQFLKELLASPQTHSTAIRWLDRSKGVFKIEDSVRVARLWGKRKNRPAMNYDKLSRSIRQYYKKGIMKKTERSQRLVYQFCHPYNL